MFTIDNHEPQPMDASHHVQLTMAETKEIIHQLQRSIVDMNADQESGEGFSMHEEKVHMLEHIIQKLQGV
ncbi:MAG: hypothetical protein WBA23_22590 [Tunicatimonas sp.]|uniref:hypothetical protein n=1 Tax=Tunicatimonas sp. TaxID=1940096 RepID=UPI003C74CA53